MNGSGTNSLDNVLVGFPMLALSTGGASNGYASTAGNDNGTSTGSITLEAWIKPRTIPSSGNEATIISQWDTSVEDDSSYRLYLNGSALTLDINDAAGTGDAETFGLGISPAVNVWTHVAVTYDAASRTLRSYENGAFVTSAVSTLDVSGIQAAAHSFAVGADSVNTPPANFFDGYVSDVRVWNDVRLSSEVARCYQKRLPTTAPCNADASLIANWRLDPTPTQGGFAEADAVAATGTAGTLTNASYRPGLAAYFRPTAPDICPDAADVNSPGIPGTIVSAYQCDFRYVEQSTTTIGVALSIPSNLNGFGAKVWGGGGGGYDTANDSAGGAGGFSTAFLDSIGGTAVAGANIDIVVGAGGTGSSSSTNGGGGGGASGVRRSSGSVNALIAGGGGGASYSANASAGCSGTINTTSQCGLGGGGGGAGSAATALTVRAPDASGVCGGKGGDNTPSGANPTNATHCTQGGTDATTSAGGGGAGQAGGASAIGAGGAGFTSASRFGAGGGGGGYPLGGEAGGQSNSADSGYGGGGSGDADGDAINVVGERSSYSATSSGQTDTSRTGDIDHPTQLRRIDDITPTLNGSPFTWQAGDSISGTCIPGSATIASGDTSNRITISADRTCTASGVALTVTSGAVGVTLSSVTGGADDFDYVPSYLDDTAALQAPGRGGQSGDVNGRAGAVVIKW